MSFTIGVGHGSLGRAFVEMMARGTQDNFKSYAAPCVWKSPVDPNEYFEIISIHSPLPV
jgi:hypothetical protein